MDKEHAIGEPKESDDDKWESKILEPKEADIPKTDGTKFSHECDDVACTGDAASKPVKTKAGGEKAVAYYKPSAPAVLGNIAVITGVRIKRTVQAVFQLGRSALAWVKDTLQGRKHPSLDSNNEVYV
jgi:hypothetical protein